MTWTCPLWQESTLLIIVYQSLLHLACHRRINKVNEWEQTTESIPETSIGEHIARQHLTIVRTVVNRLALLVDFVETTWEEHRAIQTAVECAQVVNILVLNLNLAQNIVPSLATLSHNLVEGQSIKLLQVKLSLLIADERRSHLENELVATLSACLPSQLMTLVAAVLAFLLTIEILGATHLAITLYNKIVLEIVGHTTIVICSETNKLGCRQSLDGSLTTNGINNNCCLLGIRIGYAEHAGTLCWRHLNNNVVVGKIHLVVVRAGSLSLMREPAGTLILVENHVASDRHDRKTTVIVDPRTWLVSLLETPNLVGRIRVLPSVAISAGLRSPEIHTPWHSNGRISVTS